MDDNVVHKTFFCTTTNISAMRRLVPPHIQNCSTFEVLTACLWRCRTIALQPDPEEHMPIIWPVNARKMFNPPLPVGYYGNVLAIPAVISTAQDLCNKPLGCALELVMKVKSDVMKDCIRSVSDLMAIQKRVRFTAIRAYTVSDLTRAGVNAVDFGWGKAIYGGATKGGVGLSYLLSYHHIQTITASLESWYPYVCRVE
ncbi:putative benzyl alcohol O-benzoyltransferase [Helianthus debilis subsp. tardiflorus]